MTLNAGTLARFLLTGSGRPPLPTNPGDWEVYVTTFSRRRRQVAGLTRGRHRTTLARRWQGTLFHWTVTDADGRADYPRRQLLQRNSYSSVPDSRTRLRVVHRYVYLRRRPGWKAIPGKSLS